MQAALDRIHEPMKAGAFSPDSVHQLADNFNVRWYGPLLRVAALAAFVSYLWTVQYAPHRHEPFADADGEAAIRAINAGYPFHLLYDNGPQQPPTLKRLSDVYIDSGIQIAAAFVAGCGRWLWGPSFHINPTIGREILLSLFVLTAVAMLAPAVPLLVALAGVLSFWLLFTWGPLSLGLMQHSGVAYATVVTAVFVGCAFKPWTPSRVLALAGLAAFAAISQLLRQESSAVPTSAGVGLFVAAGLIVLARRSNIEEDKSTIRRLAMRVAAGGLLLLAANGAVQPLERWLFSRAWGTSYADTPAVAHGSGAPLYLSLGYVSNPFNIGWRDPIYQLHAVLISPGLKYGDADYQPTLFREYVRIVLSRPWLLVENMMAKAARVHALATRRAEKLPDVAVWQQPPHARVYETLPWLILMCVALLWWRGTPEAAAVGVASVALGAGASAGALIVFPDYIGGVQGATVALAFIAPAAIVSYAIEPAAMPRPLRTRLARQILLWAGALIAVALLIAGGFIGVQWLRYRALQEETFVRDPLEAIAAQEFRYAHFFNDWPVARQGRVLARLTASNDPRIARVVDERQGDLELFRPELVVRTATQVHLIAWLGSSFRAPVPPLYQGTTHSLFLVCPDCTPELRVNDYPPGAGFVNDLEWRGRYRMVSLPSNTKFEAARSFHVSAERILVLDSHIEPTGLGTASMSSARVSY